MALKVERRDGGGERAVLTAMLVSRQVLAAVEQRWESPGLFATRWSNLAAGWAVAHYRKYRKAPGPAIESYFDAWAETGDRDTVRILEAYLGGLSAEYEALRRKTTPEHVLDLAKTLFTRVRLQQLRELLESDLEGGDVEAAEQRVEAYRKIEIGAGAGVDVLDDEAAVTAAFESRAEPLVVYPDALGGFFDTSLYRGAFVAFMGKEKVGKSHILQDMAIRAVEQHRRVAYFEVGDSTQNEVLRRLGSRVAGRPLKAEPYRVPLSIEPPEGKGMPAVEYKTVRPKTPISAEEAVAALRELGEAVHDTSALKLSCHPNSSIGVGGIEGVLDGWARDDWRPDVVIIDYADILAPPDTRLDKRDQINETWKAMRGLSQRRQCLLVTATQTDADSYSAKVLGRDNFSEDKRKYAHVTGMVGINQTAQEKDDQLYRLNFVVLRELAFAETKCVHAAGCLAIAAPFLVSTF